MSYVTAVVRDRTSVQGMDTRENLDQGRLARPVFTQQSDYLATTHVDSGRNKGVRAAKLLRHSAHGQKVLTPNRFRRCHELLRSIHEIGDGSG